MTGIVYYYKNIIAIVSHRQFIGWGRKRTGRFASWCHQKFGGKLTLLEDGFIRSVGLGIHGSPSFSHVEDDIGIYYDATQPSKLEKILNTYDFASDDLLMRTAIESINYIKQHSLSKYNHAPYVHADFFKEDGKQRILIIAQTAGDISLEYGRGKQFTTEEIIFAAINENPDASVYVKIHPNVLSGNKSSDIKPSTLPKECQVIRDDLNPLSLLKYFDKVYTKTSGMGFEALLLEKKVVCFGMPFYAGWGLTDDRGTKSSRQRKRTVEEVFAGAYILYTKYYNPYSLKESDIMDSIKTIKRYRNIYRQNKGNLYFFGFSRWKRRFTLPFFQTFRNNNINFCSNLEDGIKKGLTDSSKIYVWGKKVFHELEQYAKDRNIVLHRVEDGFIRSVSLGSDLTKAYSLVVDSRGIYFDPAEESDLEHILSTYDFDDDLLQRSRKLQDYLIENKISKYNIYRDKQLTLKGRRENQRIILVPGQVEDDASIIYGAKGMTNLELLQKVRENAPDAYIIYKPHPDVLAGNRKGNMPSDIALKYCDTIIKEVSVDSVLEFSDEVHTMTSLVGFEGLIRGKEVYTYGLPFYAGWGLTHDAEKCERRKIKRSLYELIAATLILYPRYIHPKTNQLCEIEVLLQEMDKEKKVYNNNLLCRILINNRNWVSRKMQLLIKVFVSE